MKKAILFIILFMTLGADEIASSSPLNLSPTWWEDTTTKKEEIREKLATFVKNITISSLQLDEKTEKLAEPLIARIQSNANIYLSEIEQPISSKTPTAFKDKYSIDEYIELSKNNYELKSQIDSRAKDLKQIKSGIKETDAVLNKNLVAYLNIKVASNEKFLLGLEIISDRLSLEMKKEYEHILQLKQDEDLLFYNHSNQELSLAKKKLQPYPISEEKAKVKVDELTRIHQNNTLKLSEAYSQLTPTFDDSIISQSRNSYLLVHLTHLSIIEGLSSIDLLTEKIKNEWIRVKTDADALATKEASKELNEWKVNINDIQNEARTWELKLHEKASKIRKLFLDEESSKNTELANIFSKFNEETQEALLNLNRLEEKIYIANFLTKEFKDEENSKLNPFNSFVFMSYNALLKGWGHFSNTLYYPLFRISGVPITPFSLFEILFIIGMSYLFSYLIRLGIYKLSQKKKIFAPSAFYTFNRVIHYVILFFGILIAFSRIGLDFSKVALIAGALSVGIGFGLQSIVKDFINGIFILFSHNYKVGDLVELSSTVTGKIKSINIQNTILEGDDGSDLVIPNSELVGHIVSNWTLSHNYRRLHIPFAVEHGVDKERLASLIIESAKKIPYTLTGFPNLADPQVWLVGFGEIGMNFELVVWINQNISYSLPAKAAYLWDIETVLKQNNISAPSSKTYIMRAGDV